MLKSIIIIINFIKDLPSDIKFYSLSDNFQLISILGLIDSTTWWSYLLKLFLDLIIVLRLSFLHFLIKNPIIFLSNPIISIQFLLNRKFRHFHKWRSRCVWHHWVPSVVETVLSRAVRLFWKSTGWLVSTSWTMSSWGLRSAWNILRLFKIFSIWIFCNRGGVPSERQILGESLKRFFFGMIHLFLNRFLLWNRS